MKTYCYYSNLDKKFEIIDKVKAKDYSEALEHFSNKKQLDQETFTKLYTITELNGN